LIALLLAGCSGDTAKPPTNGAPAPAFQAQTLTGGQVRVPRDYADKVVAIRFWADWCPYCRNEMARLQPVYARLSGRGLEILAVNVAQDRDTVRRFAGPLGLTYPVLLDPEGATARAYGVQALPITWLLDRHGVVRGKIVGEATAEVFERQVRVLLEEGGAAFPSPPAPLMELPSNRLGSQTTPAKSLLVPEGEGRGTHGR
jgi:peroxiredoxin